MVIEAGEVID